MKSLPQGPSSLWGTCCTKFVGGAIQSSDVMLPRWVGLILFASDRMGTEKVPISWLWIQTQLR